MSESVWYDLESDKDVADSLKRRSALLRAITRKIQSIGPERAMKILDCPYEKVHSMLLGHIDKFDEQELIDVTSKLQIGAQ